MQVSEPVVTDNVTAAAPRRWRDDAASLWRLEQWLVSLIAAHTIAIGAGLFVAPDWALAFGGWEVLPAAFFPRQAGIFHFVLAAGYLIELLRYRGVVLLITAKSFAFVFLLGAGVVSDVPWFVVFAGVVDGLMGITVLTVHRLLAAALRRS